MLKLCLKHMLANRAFFISFTFCILLVLGSAAIGLLSFQNNDLISIYPAWYYFGIDGVGAVTPLGAGSMRFTVTVLYLLLQLFLPFLAAMAFGAFHYDNISSGVLKTLLPRAGRGSYYRGAALTAFLGGFLVICIPLLLEQAVLCAAFPWEIPYPIERSVAPSEEYLFGASEAMQNLQVSHPYIFNCIYCILPGVTGGISALCAYACSLYSHKNRFVALTQVGIVWIILYIAFILNGSSSYFVMQRLGAFFLPVPDSYIGWWAGVSAAVLLACGALIEGKIRSVKDELS